MWCQQQLSVLKNRVGETSSNSGKSCELTYSFLNALKKSIGSRLPTLSHYHFLPDILTKGLGTGMS